MAYAYRQGFQGQVRGVSDHAIEPTTNTLAGTLPKDAERLARTLASCEQGLIFWARQPEDWVLDLLDYQELSGHLGPDKMSVYVAGPDRPENRSFRTRKARTILGLDGLNAPELQAFFQTRSSATWTRSMSSSGESLSLAAFIQAQRSRPVFWARAADREPEAQLIASPLVAVSSASGCGKSSLVLAGLLKNSHPAARGRPRMALRAVTARQSTHANLAGLLATALDTPAANDENRVASLDGRLRLGGLGLTEAVRVARLGPQVRMLVVSDQFEEIFRFKRMIDPEEATAFVKLLLNAARDTDSFVRVVLTMRTDSLGSCADFRDLPEAISRGLYLVPRLTREQRKEAIIMPVELRGFKIAPRLVQRIMNDVTDNFDDLPVMQHVLTRTWQHWAKACQGSRDIDLEDYEAEEIGTAANALSNHADEAYKSLTGLAKVVEKVFRALIERVAEGHEIRRPLNFEQLCAVTGCDKGEVEQVVERFRRPDTAFLMPPPEVPLSTNPVIDISHESLIRLSARLRQWTQREAESHAELRRLVDAADRHYDKDQGGSLWPGRDLERALEWPNLLQPTAPWVSLYTGGDGIVQWKFAQTFLADSEQALKHERIAQELSRRRVTFGLVAGLLVALVLAGLAALQWHRAKLAAAAAAKQRDVARSQALAVLATELPPVQYRLALLLAAEAARIEETELARSRLINLLQVRHRPSVIQEVHGGDKVPDSEVATGRWSNDKRAAVVNWGRGFLVRDGRLSFAGAETISNKGELVAVRDGDTIKVIAVPSGDVRTAFVPDAPSLTPAGSYTTDVREIALSNEAEVTHLAVCFSIHSREDHTSTGAITQVWRIVKGETPRLIDEFPINQPSVNAWLRLHFVGTSDLFVAVSGERLILRDYSARETVGELYDEQYVGKTGLDVSSDGRFLAWGRRIWEIRSGPPPQFFELGPFAEWKSESLEFSPDSQVLAVLSERAIELVSVPALIREAMVAPAGSPVEVGLTDKALAVLLSDGTIWKYDRSNLSAQRPAYAHSLGTVGLKASSSQLRSLIAGISGGSVRILGTTDAKLVELPVRGTNVVVLSPDGKTVGVLDASDVFAVWDISSLDHPKLIGELHLVEEHIERLLDGSMALAVTAGGNAVYLSHRRESRGRELELWNPKTEEATTLPLPSVCNPSALTFDPKNEAVVAYGGWCGSAGRLDPVVVFELTASSPERQRKVLSIGAPSSSPSTVARWLLTSSAMRPHRRLGSAREAALALRRKRSRCPCALTGW